MPFPALRPALTPLKQKGLPLSTRPPHRKPAKPQAFSSRGRRREQTGVLPTVEERGKIKMETTTKNRTMKHPFDKILANDETLGPEAEMLWIEMKDANPQMVRDLWRKNQLKEYLQTAEQQLHERAKQLVEAGEGEAEAWEIARHEAEEDVHPKDATTEVEAMRNLAPMSMWALAMEVLAAGGEPADLLGSPEKRAAALTLVAEYRKKKAAASATPDPM